MPKTEIVKTKSERKTIRQKGPWLFMALSVVIVAGLVFGGYRIFSRVDDISFRDVKIANETFKLEVADNEDLRIKGLSNRDGLAKNEGMLFDFKTDGDWRIWMVDMRFNIDIIWLDSSGEIVFIKEYATPALYPEVFHAYTPNRYVIELSAGTVERLGLKTNDAINL